MSPMCNLLLSDTRITIKSTIISNPDCFLKEAECKPLLCDASIVGSPSDQNLQFKLHLRPEPICLTPPHTHTHTHILPKIPQISIVFQLPPLTF